MKDKYYHNDTIEPVEKVYLIKGVTVFIAFVAVVVLLPSLLFIPVFLASCEELHNYHNQKKQCDSSVQGTIVEFKEYIPEYDKLTTLYRPVFSYECNGKEYRYEQSNVNMENTALIGQKREILIYSDDPNIAYIPPSISNIKYNTKIVIKGGIIYTVYLISTVIVVWTIKSLKKGEKTKMHETNIN